mgnify:CR=1 FL=1
MSLLFRSNHGKKTPITQKTWQQVDSQSSSSKIQRFLKSD